MFPETFHSLSLSEIADYPPSSFHMQQLRFSCCANIIMSFEIDATALETRKQKVYLLLHVFTFCTPLWMSTYGIRRISTVLRPTFFLVQQSLGLLIGP